MQTECRHIHSHVGSCSRGVCVGSASFTFAFQFVFLDSTRCSRCRRPVWYLQGLCFTLCRYAEFHGCKIMSLYVRISCDITPPKCRQLRNSNTVFMTLIHKKTDNCGETDFKLATIIHYHLKYRYKTMTDAFSPFFKSFNPVSKAAGGTHAPHMRALTSCDDEGRSV